MKQTLTIALLTACSAAPLCALADEPVTPPSPPAPPAAVAPPTPPAADTPPERKRVRSFLGVEVSRIPGALSDQLNLPEGFGVLVDYVVPGSSAEIAGVKPHDILKMINDQIVTGSEHLSVLVRSYAEGQEVTLTILRKGQEMKLTAKLQKHVAKDNGHRRGDDAFNFNFNFDDLTDGASAEQLRDALERSREQIEASTERARDQAERAKDQAQRAMDLARAQMERATASRFNFKRASIVMRDRTGKVELRIADGRRRLKVKDDSGKTIFDGPIDTAEQRKAIPKDVLPQVEKLEQEQATSFPDGSSNDHVDVDGDN